MNYLVLTYSFYLVLTIALTIWVARLLDVGFYLVAFGCSFLMLRINAERYYDEISGLWKERTIAGTQNVIEILSQKIGAFVLILGIMLFLNLLILLTLRKGKNRNEARLGTYPPSGTL